MRNTTEKEFSQKNSQDSDQYCPFHMFHTSLRRETAAQRYGMVQTTNSNGKNIVICGNITSMNRCSISAINLTTPARFVNWRHA